MPSRTLPRQAMRDILWEEYGGKVLRDEITSNGRWSIHHRLVFQFEEDGKLYEANYSVGATEQQDERAWEHEEQVTVHEVKADKVEQVIYRRVPDKGEE